MMLPRLSGLLLLLWGSLTHADDIAISVVLPDERRQIDNFLEITQERDCADIQHYALPGSTRVLAEMILVCQALKLGGLRPQFEFKPVVNYSRALLQVSTGQSLMMMESVWLRDTDPSKVYISEPVFKTGEFEVGVFTRPDHKAMLQVRTVEELRGFMAISNRNWVVDWATLEYMRARKKSTSRYTQMFQMVGAGRADYMLNSFSTDEDMGQVENGIRLVPVPNVKIGLKGSRHILVNKFLPNAARVYNALQVGLKILREQGVIRRALEESGFLHPQVRAWRLLCCQE